MQALYPGEQRTGRRTQRWGRSLEVTRWLSQLPGAQRGWHGEGGSWSSRGVTAVRGAPQLTMPQGLPGQALLLTLPHDPARGPACARACGGAAGHSAVTFLRWLAATAAQTPRDARIIQARGLSGSTGTPGTFRATLPP